MSYDFLMGCLSKVSGDVLVGFGGGLVYFTALYISWFI